MTQLDQECERVSEKRGTKVSRGAMIRELLSESLKRRQRQRDRRGSK